MLKNNVSDHAAKRITFVLAMLLMLISSTAQALIQRSFVNLGFESVQISNGSPCRVYASQGASVPGWSTTHPSYSATDRVVCPPGVNAGVDTTSVAPIIEVWKGPRDINGGSGACTTNTENCISARSGSQFVELNAAALSEIRQQVCLESGETVGWKFSHNGRNTTADRMRFKAGTQSIVQVSTSITGTGSVTSCDTGNCSTPLSARTTITGDTRWADYSGSFTASGSNNTYIGFESLNGSSTSGNFLDDIQVTLKPAVEFKLGNYTDVENINASQSVEVQVVGIVPANINLNFTIDPTSTAVIGTDYTINNGTSTSFNISLAAGDYSDGKVISIPVKLLNNSVVEGSRSFKVILTPDATKFTIMPTSTCTNTGGNASSTYSIQDDDIGLQLEKTWVNASVSDKATLTTTGGASGASNINYVSTATAANVSNASNAIILAAGASRTLAETLSSSNTGAYNASVWSCDGGSLSGSVLTTSTADYGKVIKCTVTNSRTTSLQLAKVWGANSLSTDSATIGATTGASNNTTAFSTPGGTNANSGAPVAITVGNTITFPAETGTNIANYNTVLSCTANGGATVNALSGTNGQVSNTLVITAGDAGKSIVCSYTNTRKSTTFRLAKAWAANSLTGNVANIGATTGLTNNTAAFTSTASTATNGTAVTVYAGETATLPAETMSSGTLANYTTAISCNAGTLSGTNGQSVGNTLAITAAATATSPITCTYTNTRKSASLTLQKIWANAKLNDASSITATGLTSLSAVANTTSETDATTGQTVYAGDSITLGETFSTGSATNYNATLACTGNATALTGTTLTVNPADTAITCSYTNSRVAQQLSLAKQWQNAVNGHSATVTTTGGSNNTSVSSISTGNNSTSGSAVTVYAGDIITLPTETFGGGATAAQYNSALACVGGTPLASGAVARSITITNSTTATVCSYTNTRKSAILTLSKIWSSGSIAGNTVTVTSTGFGNNASSGTSTATAAGNTTTGTGVTVYAGETGTISETFGTGSASNYTANLACSGNSTALTGSSLTINPADTAITCSYTNTVTGADLAIDKTGSSSVTQDSTVSYTIKVWNKGPVVVSSSTFSDNVPAGVTNVSWTCNASGTAICGTASGTGNSITVTTGTLPVNNVTTAPTADSYLTFNVTGTAASVGNISNTASIAVTSGTDPVMANNSSSASTTVNAPTAITPDTPQKEARFTITPDVPTIYRGQAGMQLVTIKNEGPDNATSTVATFKPRTQTGVTVTSVKVAGGANCSLSSGEWSCPVGSVANGGSFQLEVGYDTTASSTLGTAIQADIRVGSNEFNPGSGVGESFYNVWGSTNPNGSSQFNEIRPNGAFALGYGTANANENVNLSTAWLPTQVNPTGAYLTQAAIGGNNSVFGPSGTYSPTISRIITSLNTDTAKSQTLLALNPATQAGDNRRVWQLTTGIYVPANSTASLCIGNAGSQLDDGAYIMLDGAQVGVDGKWSSNPYIQNSVTLNTGYNRITYRIANRNTPGSNEDYAQGLYGEIGLSLNGGACTAANLDSTARLQIPASINIVEKQVVTITGQVFEDNSGSTAVNSNAYNGIKDTGEVGIADSTVTINNCANTTAIATTKTDANGEYTFNLLPTVLPVGNFCIAQKNLDGYSSVSGTTGYNRVTDQITVSNTGASSYANHNFGDARLNVVLTEDGQQTIIAGGVADYPHRLTAQSVLTVTSLGQISTQQPANSTDAPWQSLLYRDLNCNGKVDAGENLMSASLPLSLKANEQVCLVQRVYAPATASMGAQHIGQLQASFNVSLANPTETITGSSIKRQDTTLLGSAGLNMQKAVRSVASCPSTAADTTAFTTTNQAQSGGYLEYEITYRNNSNKNLIDVTIKDSVPAGTVFQNSTCHVTPVGTCTATKTGDVLLWQNTATLLPSQQGKVRFCVQVP